MMRIVKFLKRNKFEIILFLLLLVLVCKAWLMLPQLTSRGDSFAAMLSRQQYDFWHSRYPLASLLVSEMILGAIMPKIFGVHFSYYYWFELVVILLIAVLFYVVIKAITKNYLVAFSASLLLSVSYFGVYDMVSTHCYCFFLERIIPVPFLISSFWFLHLFLEGEKRKYLIFSLLFYFLGVGLGHFSILITPLFFFYAVFYKFQFKKKYKEKIKGIFLGCLYVLLTAFFVAIQQINESGISPHQWTFVGFFLNPQKYLYFKKIALQFVYWSQYPVFLQSLSRNPMSSFLDFRDAPIYIPLTLVVYLLVGFTIYKRLPKQRFMLFTVMLALPIIFYLNGYLGQYDMLNFTGASRYLYHPTFLLAIFWSYFLWAVFWQKKNILLLGGFLLLALYYVINVWLINSNIVYEIKWNKPTRMLFEYVLSHRSKLDPKTLVIVTYPEFGSQESTFFTEQIGKGQVQYLSDNNLVNPITWESTSSSSAHVIKLKYGEKCTCVIEERVK